MTPTTVFVEVPVLDKTPPKLKRIIVISSDGHLYQSTIDAAGYWDTYFLKEGESIVAWLEKQEDVFVLTKSQLEDFARAMRKYTIDHAEYVPQAGNTVWITGTVDDFMDEQLNQ